MFLSKHTDFQTSHSSLHSRQLWTKMQKMKKNLFPELALQFHFSHHISCLLDFKKISLPGVITRMIRLQLSIIWSFTCNNHDTGQYTPNVPKNKETMSAWPEGLTGWSKVAYCFTHSSFLWCKKQKWEHILSLLPLMSHFQNDYVKL